MSHVCSKGVRFGKVTRVGDKGYVMFINIISLEDLDPVTVHEYLSIHLLASEDHLTPTCGSRFYILLRVKCAVIAQ